METEVRPGSGSEIPPLLLSKQMAGITIYSTVTFTPLSPEVALACLCAVS